MRILPPKMKEETEEKFEEVTVEAATSINVRLGRLN